jgi:outer membrane protein OmpA-like peptidoglycan-associated protein
MDHNNRTSQRKQPMAPTPRLHPAVDNAGPTSLPLENSEAVQRAKAHATSKIRARDVLTLQSSIGNKGVRRLLADNTAPVVQGHWMPGEPEEVQAMPQVQRRALSPAQKVQAHWMPGEPEEIQAMPQVQRRSQPAFGNPAYRMGVPGPAGLQRNLWARQNRDSLVQRQEKGGAGVKGAPAAKEVPAAKEAPKTVVTFGALSFAPHEIPADGKTTSQANAKVAPPGRKIDWSIDGDDYGTTVSKSGLVTAGSDTKGQESVTLKVKAADEEQPEVFSLGKLTLWDAKFFQAKKDFPKFVAGNYNYSNFTIGRNGKFDVDYQPAGNLVNVIVKVKFEFPDDPIPKPSLGNLFGLLIKGDVAAADARHKAYRDNFMKQIVAQWSGRYQFQNVREPQSIWGKLNPTSLKVNVVEVDSNQHFLIQVKQKTKGRASVGGGVTKLFQGSDVPAPAFNPTTADGELLRVRRNTPTPILFDNSSSDLPGADQSKLQFLGTYLSRINNPKFDISIVGHASATGDKAKNQMLSEKRAQAAAGILTGAGATQHNINASGVGQTGASKDAAWRKVEITTTIPAGWQNMQDVTAHEFGHMIGLGDEYAAGGADPNATHYALVEKAFGKEYAEQVAKRGDTDYASIMEGGSDVRIQHYVTMWSGLCETTMKAPLPDPKFGYDDWKFIG